MTLQEGPAEGQRRGVLEGTGTLLRWALLSGAFIVLVGMAISAAHQQGTEATDIRSVASVPRGGARAEKVTISRPPSHWQQDSLVEGARYGGLDDFGKIVAMRPLGRYLVVGDSYLSPHIAVLDLQDGTIVARIGTHGQGPGEFRSPTWLAGAGPSSVWVDDFYNRRLTLLELDGAGQPKLGQEIPLLVATTTEYPAVMGDRIASAGLYGDDAVVMFFDREGRPLLKAGKPPFSFEQVGHSTGIRLVNRATMEAKPDRSRLAVAFYSANRVDVFSAEGDLLGSGQGPREPHVSFHVADKKFFWDLDENQLAYTSIASSKEAVFALYCGCVNSAPDPADRTRIHVFDWQGRFQRELMLPTGVHRIAVSEDGRTLFGAIDDPWPAITTWRIPQPTNHGDQG